MITQRKAFMEVVKKMSMGDTIITGNYLGELEIENQRNKRIITSLKQEIKRLEKIHRNEIIQKNKRDVEDL